MIWIEKLRELGVTPAEGDTFSPLSDDGVAEIENKVGGTFPDDYREFLSRFGDCLLELSPSFPTEGGGVSVGWFFGRELISAIEDYGERLPTMVVPINDDGGSNLICLSLRPKTYGVIYFQHHCIGWDSETTDQDAAKSETLFRLADSFSEFICGLVVK